MAFTTEISRANPGCFLLLIDQSDSMRDRFGGVAGNRTKAEGVADAINRFLQNLVIKCTKSEGVRDYFEVGIIGYGATIGPAFGGALVGRDLVRISEVANAARLEERMQKLEDGAGGLVEQKVKVSVWLDPITSNGTPMAGALSYAHRILSEWVGMHPESIPPIVVNITDGEVNDDDPVGPAQQLMNLRTQDGNLLVLNCHISSRSSTPILYPHTEDGLPDEFARMLFRMSSVLPDQILQTAREEGFQIEEHARGFAFNADLVDVINFLDIGTRPSRLQMR